MWKLLHGEENVRVDDGTYGVLLWLSRETGGHVTNCCFTLVRASTEKKHVGDNTASFEKPKTRVHSCPVEEASVCSTVTHRRASSVGPRALEEHCSQPSETDERVRGKNRSRLSIAVLVAVFFQMRPESLKPNCTDSHFPFRGFCMEMTLSDDFAMLRKIIRRRNLCSKPKPQRET